MKTAQCLGMEKGSFKAVAGHVWLQLCAASLCVSILCGHTRLKLSFVWWLNLLNVAGGHRSYVENLAGLRA